MSYTYWALSAATLLLAFTFSEWFLLILYTIFLLIALLFGMHIFVASHLDKSSKRRRRTSAERPPLNLDVMKKYLMGFESKSNKPKRLPVIFGRMLDDAVQQLIDLTLQEAIGDWLVSNGFSCEDILLTMKEDVWKLIQNLQERLTHIDLVKLVADKVVSKVTLHFEKIRLAQSPRNKDLKMERPSYLASYEAEMNYLRCIAESALSLLLPKYYLEVVPIRHLLREILACKVLFSAIETLTDPDYINQKILLYVHQPEHEPQRRKSYTYAASFEDFIQMIKDSKDIEVLNQIRNSIMNEIIQASTVHSKKKSQKASAEKEVFGHGIARGDLLQGRQVQRYIHQLTYAKSQCEKQLAALGCTSGVEEAVEATALSGRKILQLDTLLDNPTCRKYLARFLEQGGDKVFLKCWEAIEELRQANHCEWHQLATDIFYKFINNPSPSVPVEKNVLKRMEQFLLGNQGPEVFFEVQKNIAHMLEEKVYPSFLVSDHYQSMEDALEHELDAEPAEEACLQDSDDPPISSVVEESSYPHRKLDEIQKRLKDKTQALEALRCNMKPDHSVLSRLESDVETLQGEKRQLEAHLMRTEAWSEHLGRWRAVVQSAEQISEEKESLQFVLVVHVLEDETDSEAVSTGWVVLRRLSEFQDLHRKLSQLTSNVKNLELPSQSLKFRFGKSAVEKGLEKAKGQIQKYLQFVLEDDVLNKSEAVYSFLSPSSEHLKQTLPSPQKPKFLSALLKKPLQLVEGLSSSGESNTDSAVPDSDDDSFLLLLDEGDGRMVPSNGRDGKDGIAEPLYDLMEEIFDLRDVFMWLRKTLITFVQITYNKTISRQVRETVAGLFSEHEIYSYLQFIMSSWWIDGKLKDSPPPRTEEQKMKTRSDARDHFLANIPELLSGLVGQQASKRGAIKVFDALQDPLLNKQLLYDILGVVLQELFPEM